MPKHIDAVPSISTFKAPWESEQGETEIDKDKLKKYIHNLLTDKAKAQDARDEAGESLKAAEAARDEYKEQVDGKDPDASKKIAKLEDAVREAKAEVAKAELRADRVEVAAELGLTLKQAKRLQGTTKEELEADAKELLEDLGITPGANETDEEREEREEREAEEAERAGRVQPRTTTRLINGGDPRQASDAEVDYEAAAAQISQTRVL